MKSEIPGSGNGQMLKMYKAAEQKMELRRTDGICTKLPLEWNSSLGHRSRGRPNTKCCDDIRKLAGIQ